MIYERFWLAYEEDKKLMLDLYQEIKGYRKNKLSEDELKDLYKDTFQTLEELLYGEDVDSALIKFFDEIKQYRYAGLLIDMEFLIFSDASPYGKHNREILKKYLKSKDNEKFARIINYLGIIVDVTYLEKNKLSEIYNIKLKDPEELSSLNNETNDVDENKIEDNKSGLKTTIYNFLSSVGNKIRDIATEVDKFFKKIAGYEYVRDFLKDLIDDVLYIVVSYPEVTGLAGLMTLIMMYSTHSLRKVLNSDYNSLAISIRSLSNKFSNISILTNRFVKAGVKVSVMASSVYILKKVFNDLKQEHNKRTRDEISKLHDLTEDVLNEVEEKLSESGYKKMLNLIKSKFGKGLLESPVVISGLIKVIYAVLWSIIIFITNIALVLNEMFNIKSNRLKIIGLLTALGISNVF